MPRPYGDTVHGTAPGEVVHFDFLYVGGSGPEGSEGLLEEDGFRYILVIMDDLSNFRFLGASRGLHSRGYGYAFAQLVQDYGCASCVGE